MKLILGAMRFDGRRLPPRLLETMAAEMAGPEQAYGLRCWISNHAAMATMNFGCAEGSSTLAVRYSGGVFAGDVRLDEPDQAGSRLHCEGAGHEILAEALLDRYGSEAYAMLAGDFALANWNIRKRELTLARDAMGVRPLVFHSVPGRYVVFASFPRGLHASGLLERSLDQLALLREMMGIRKAEDSLFLGVESVRPGTSVTLCANTRRQSEFWRPRLSKARFRSPEEGAEALGAALQSAVQSRTAGHGPVATHLSGGLDSSAISVLAARQLASESRELLAYQFVDGQSYDSSRDAERPYVQAVLRQEPTIQWFPILQPSGTPQSMLMKDRVLSEDAADPENQACAAASARGARLMLSGWGGDEGATFNGRGALATALFTGRWPYLRREFRALRTRRGFTSRQVVQGEVWPYLRSRSNSQRTTSATALAPWFNLLKPPVRKRVLESIGREPRMGIGVRGNQARLLGGSHLELRANNWAEIGARFGMAFAFPMLDRRVMECALSIPGEWFLREGWKRSVFRDAMKGVLPEVVRRRHDKLTPFPFAMHSALTQVPEMVAKVRAMATRPVFRSLFEEAAVERWLSDTLHTLTRTPGGDAIDQLLPLGTLLAYGDFLLRERSCRVVSMPVPLVPVYARGQHG